MLGITVPQGEGGLVGQVAPAAEAAVDEEGEGGHTLGDGGAPAAREAVEQHVLPTEAKEQTGSRKRKNFDEVSKSTKHGRVKNIVHQLDENPGLEGAVLKTLKRRESEESDVSNRGKGL